jgi:hypothetical protein
MLLYGLFLGFALIRIWPLTNGDQIYLLDDTYIHLAIAKNLLLHGNYGISAVEPAMASSSILWPYLLAFGGKSVLLPLLLNVIFSLALLAIALKVMRGSDVTSLGWQTVTLVLVVIGFPLTTMTLDGMEHVLFGLVFILFVWRAGLVMGGERLNDPLKESGNYFFGVVPDQLPVRGNFCGLRCLSNAFAAKAASFSCDWAGRTCSCAHIWNVLASSWGDVGSQLTCHENAGSQFIW